MSEKSCKMTRQPMTTTPTTYTENHTVTLTKDAKRNLQEKVINNNLRDLLNSVNNRAIRVRGWVVTERPDERNRTWRQRYGSETEYRYELYLSVAFSREDGKKPESNELPALLRTISVRAGQPAFGRWTLAEVDDEPWKPGGDEDVTDADSIGYAQVDMPTDWDEFFAHLYGLDPHVSRIKRALEAGMLSEWNNRYHVALVGPPGCGKSDICQSMKRALGENAVMEFDATATTAAGAIAELSERDILPRVLIVEEIEKADEKSLSFLLSLMDLRSEIRKTTARGKIVRDTKLFVVATVNNVPLFEKLQAGALASRFSNMIGFQRPSRDQLAMILRREVGKVGGDERWIDPALDYCEEQNITDPRMVTSICLCGRDMLVDGSYQKMLSETAYKPTTTETEG